MKQKSGSTPFWRFLFVVYAAVMLWLLFGRSSGWTEGLSYRQQLQNNANLVPFHTIRNYWTVVRRMQYNDLFRHCLINLGGNIFLFIPFGWLLPKLWAKQQNFLVFLSTCVVSIVAVEFLQLITLLGSMDVDDLILNLSGMLLGYGLCLLFNKKR